MRCKCKICKEIWHYSGAISPMLTEIRWQQVLKHYNLKDIKGTFICYKCMEKALGRRLKKSDINNSPFNEAFREWYYFRK